MIKSKFIEENLCVKVYDPAVPGTVIDVYRNYAEASKRLCISAKKIRYAANHKTRLFIPSLEKEVVFRCVKSQIANAA